MPLVSCSVEEDRAFLDFARWKHNFQRDNQDARIPSNLTDSTMAQQKKRKRAAVASPLPAVCSPVSKPSSKH